jgi:predicted membrane protein
MDEERWERRRERWEKRSKGHRRGGNPEGQAFVGIVMLAIGFIFLLNNMGYVSAPYIFRNFWPVILILIGARMLIFDRSSNGMHGPRGVGLVWLVLGSVFLLRNLDFINVAFRTIWPFFPMAIGAFILWKVFVDRDDTIPPREQVRDEPPEDFANDRPNESQSSSGSRIGASAVLGHVQRRSNSQEFRGGSLSSFMGMCEVDLRGALPVAGGAVFDVSAFMGGIEIRVPADWVVDNRVAAFLGSVEDETTPPQEEVKKLIIRGSVFMGGLEVKN